MKICKLFVSSTLNTMSKDKELLASFLQMLNMKLKKFSIYFKLEFIPYEETSFGQAPNKETIGNAIKDTTLALFLIDTDIDLWTEYEFDVAYEWFKMTSKPRVIILFKSLKDDHPSGNVKRFEEKIRTELNHYYSLYEMEDQLKWRLLIELTLNMPELSLDMKQGTCAINDVNIDDVDLRKAPFYANHKRLKALEDEYKKLELVFSDPSQDIVDVLKANDQMNVIEKEIQEIEKTIVKVFQSVYDSAGKNQMTPLMRRASVFLERGDIETASKILNTTAVLEQSKKTEEDVIKQMASAVQKLEAEIDTMLASIHTQLQLDSPTRFEEVNTLYLQCIRLEETYNLNRYAHQKYAWFLINQNRYDQAYRVSLSIQKWMNEKDNSSHGDVIESLRLIGLCERMLNKTSDALNTFLKAIELEHKHLEQNPTESTYLLASLHESIALVYTSLNQWHHAKTHYMMAGDIYKQMIDSKVNNSKEDLAINKELLGSLYESMELFDQALTMYQESLSIWNSEKQSDEETKETRMAEVYNAMANIYLDNHQLIEAEPMIMNSYEINKKWFDKNPERYGCKFVTSISLLSFLQLEKDQSKESFLTYNQGTDILRNLAKANPLQYNEILVYHLLRYASRYYSLQSVETVNIYSEAYELLEIYSDNDELQLYLHTKILQNVVRHGFYVHSKQFIEERKRDYLNNLESLAQKNFLLYAADLATGLSDLNNIYDENISLAKRIKAHLRIVDIKLQLAQMESMAYVSGIANAYSRVISLFEDKEVTIQKQEEFLLQGLKTITDLVNRNEAYRIDLVKILEALCSLYHRSSQKEKLYMYTTQMIEHSSIWVNQNPERYIHDYADTLRESVLYYLDKNDRPFIEEYTVQIIDIYKDLIEKRSIKYQDDLYKFYIDVAGVYRQDVKWFEKYYSLAIELIEQKIEKDPNTLHLRIKRANDVEMLASKYRVAKYYCKSLKTYLIALQHRIKLYEECHFETILYGNKQAKEDVLSNLSRIMDEIIIHLPSINLLPMFETFKTNERWNEEFDQLNNDVLNELSRIDCSESSGN